MTSRTLDDFIDDCFVEKDPLCSLHKKDALWLDLYASTLIAGRQEKQEEGGGVHFDFVNLEEKYLKLP